MNVNIDNEEKVVYKKSVVTDDERINAKKTYKAQEKFESERVSSKFGGYLKMGPDDIYVKQDPIPNYKESDCLYLKVAPYEPVDTEDIKLEDLLNNFFRTELLNNIENYYKCPDCNKNKNEKPRFITKKFFLYQPEHD